MLNFEACGWNKCGPGEAKTVYGFAKGYLPVLPMLEINRMKGLKLQKSSLFNYEDLIIKVW